MAGNNAKPRARSRWLWWVIPIAAVIVLIVLLSMRPPQVEVATARTGDLTITITATGEVEGRVADISPTLSGRVEAVYRDEGDWVGRGDLLCRLTPAPGMPAERATLTAHESVVAPFDGVVSRRYVDPGDAALPGKPLFQVADPGEMWVVALVDDIDAGKVHAGMEAQVSLPSYMSESLAATITDVAATAVPRTELGTGGKVVRARLELNRPNTSLRPGMEVDVRTESVVARGAVLIPADAIVESEAERHVFVVRDGRVQETPVEVGANNYLDTEVVGGLSSGEVVVVGGKEGLADGRRVSTVEVKGE